jgi:hypothetical protein
VDGEDGGNVGPGVGGDGGWRGGALSWLVGIEDALGGKRWVGVGV